MTRLNIICEGQTETTFINALLAPHLAELNIGVGAPLLGRAGHKGGAVTLARIQSKVLSCMLQDRQSYCTTLVDYYGIDDNFPGKKEARIMPNLPDKHDTVCVALSDSLAETLDEGPMRRFIPYVQMHEFEGLLFSDPNQLASALRRQNLA